MQDDEHDVQIAQQLSTKTCDVSSMQRVLVYFTYRATRFVLRGVSLMFFIYFLFLSQTLSVLLLFIISDAISISFFK